MEAVVKFLKENGPFYLATLREGKPRVRPIGVVVEAKGHVCMAVGTYKEVYKELQACPDVSVCASMPGGGEKWIRITGKAVLTDDPEIVDKIFEDSPFLHDMYNEKTGHKLGAFYIEGTACIHAMPGDILETYELK